MSSKQSLRQMFLEYFEKQGHTSVAGSSLVPENDPTLLFTNAGMVPFKDLFLGTRASTLQRATSVQRCMRAGGKHNDLENVGYTARHHTFFEMLGNFSFGAYFKHDAIAFAWEFLVQVLGLSPSRLWVTVHHDDQDSEQIWLNEVGVPADRIVRLGDDSNFWRMGDTGPCGPCSEIFYDHGDAVPGGPPGSADEDGDRYVEIWNLVFMQFNCNSAGDLTPLPQVCVDTGMGLERLTAVMEGVVNNFDTSLFTPLLAKIVQISGRDDDCLLTSRRVIADHIRAIAFLICDGVMPSNEGRGYVLRRIIRRAARHGVKMGLVESFLYRLLPTLTDIMGVAYPFLKEKQTLICQIIKQEETQFAATLVRGLRVFEQCLPTLSDHVLPGDFVFTLYDTYGFPPDMTADLARERQLTLDYAGFESAMATQREQSRRGQSFKANMPTHLHMPGQTDFLGYDQLSVDAAVVQHLLSENLPVDVLNSGQKGVIILDRTPFYAESGGQVGDAGVLYQATGKFLVSDTQKQGDHYLHIGRVAEGSFALNDVVTAEVSDKRTAIMRHHSATHLLHSALRRCLGDHVQQKGSHVDAKRLRFDFTHSAQLTEAECESIENLVNAQIQANLPVTCRMMSPDEVKAAGAIALFDQKYGDQLRVLKMGEFSIEACGGTHVAATGQIGFFKLMQETACSAGVRRIEAIAGEVACQWAQSIDAAQTKMSALLHCSRDKLWDQLTTMVAQQQSLQKNQERLEQQLVNSRLHELSAQAETLADCRVLVTSLEAVPPSQLRPLMDQLKAHLSPCIIVLASTHNEKLQIVCGVSKAVTDRVSAKALLRVLTDIVGGRGGGRDDFAQGGGDKLAQLPQALSAAKQWLQEKLV